MVLPGVGFFGSGQLAQILLRDLQNEGFQIVALWSPTIEEAKRLSQICCAIASTLSTTTAAGSAATSNSISNSSSQSTITTTTANHQVNRPHSHRLYSNQHKHQQQQQTWKQPICSSRIDVVLLMPQVQLIIMCCPPHFHNQIASKACGIGKHVVCDWPPSICLKDAINMKNAASNYPSLITLLMNGLRFLPTFTLMRKLIIESNLLGPLKLINASINCDVALINKEKSLMWDQNMGGGLLSFYGTNIIDIISFVTGYRCHRVHGLIHCLKQLSNNPILYNNTEDFVNFQMELFPISKLNIAMNIDKVGGRCDLKDEPIIANVILNGHHYNSPVKHELQIYGTNGYLICRDGELYQHINDFVKSNISTNLASPVTPISANPFLTSKETLIYSLNERDITSSTIANTDTFLTMIDDSSSSISSTISNTSTTSSITSPLTTTISYCYPSIYLLGIKRMISALKLSFYDESEQLRQYQNNKNYKQDDNENNDNEFDNDKHKSTSSSILMVKWRKDPVNQATNFNECLYIQSVINAIRISSETREWIRIHHIPDFC